MNERYTPPGSERDVDDAGRVSHNERPGDEEPKEKGRHERHHHPQPRAKVKARFKDPQAGWDEEERRRMRGD